MEALVVRHRRRSGVSAGRRRRPSVLSSVVARLCDPTDRSAFLAVAVLLLTLEAATCALIIRHVPYTEIDYTTYLQQVEGFERGERDYRKLGGDTGPLVYPAGHLYIYSLLRRWTGGSVQAAQVAFSGLYLATQAVVMLVYVRTRTVPPWSLALLCTSRRLHSIYLLRLFNDCWAMFLAYCATAVLQGRRWVPAVVLYSLAVSVKMNVLLMAPGVLAVLIKAGTPLDLAAAVGAGVLLQAALGAPFLLRNPSSYMAKAFEFSRVFMHRWTVNWKFVPVSWFTSTRFGLLLLATHARLLWSLLSTQWFAGSSLPRALSSFMARQRTTFANASTDAITFAVFSANLVGILCSRTLHYQFYSWYFHTLPFLLLRKESACPVWLALSLLMGIEVIWNLYPPMPLTSAVLLALHCGAAAFVVFGAAFREKARARHA